MGNQQTVPINIQVIKPQNWIQAGQDQQKVLFSNVNPYRKRLLANIITHQLIEQYELNFIAQQDYNNYVKQLNFRQSTTKAQNGFKFHSKSQNLCLQYIYPIRYFINKSKNQMCTTIHTGYLYVDKIDLRLKQINDIPFPDLLYIYKATLIGFKFLYEKVGYFDIQQEMIFINRKGQVKVWMNANLAKNYPNFQKKQNPTSRQMENYTESQHLYGSQADMIKDLIYLIQKNADQNTPQYQTILFSQYLENKNIIDKLSFQHCIEEFNIYLHENNLHCSDQMRSIPQLFSPEVHFNANQTNYQQSHVNQLTSHRLNQMKKKFQPMETIPEDQKHQPQSDVNTFINYKPSNTNPNPRGFQQSKVSNFTPQKIAVIQQNYNKDALIFENNSKNVVRPGQQPYTDLNKSRYSQYSVKNNRYQNQKLQKSSYSNNANQVHHPNSLSQLNYKNESNMSSQNMTPNKIVISNQPFIHPIQPNQIHYTNQNNKVFLVSPPPSFRIMGGINGISPVTNSHPIVYHQNVNFVHPQQKIVIQNHPMQRKVILPHQNISFTNSQPIQQDGFTPSKQQLKIPINQSNISQKPLPPHLPPKSPSSINIQRIQSSMGSQIQNQQNTSKSNIKYFTTKNAYKLDDEIANDLQKFLGLKVN